MYRVMLIVGGFIIMGCATRLPNIMLNVMANIDLISID